jgi:hypothetical protein
MTQLGIYQANGSPWNLKRVLGDGAEFLTYQGRRGEQPGFYHPPGIPTQPLFSFSTIKYKTASVFDPQGEEKIQQWRSRIGEAQADRICSESKAAGEMGHRMLENWTQGNALGVYPLNMEGYKYALEWDILPYLHRDEPGLAIVDDEGEVIRLSEVFVADFEAQFVGRLDLVTRISADRFEDQHVLLELKGSVKPKRVEYMQPHIIQGVAYQSTFNKIAAAYPDQLVPLDGVAIAYMYREGRGEFVPVFGEELREYEREWLGWLDCFHQLLGGLFVHNLSQRI